MSGFMPDVRVRLETPQHSVRAEKSVERELSQLETELSTLEASIAELHNAVGDVRCPTPENPEKDGPEIDAECLLATRLKSSVIRTIKLHRMVQKTISELQL